MVSENSTRGTPEESPEIIYILNIYFYSFALSKSRFSIVYGKYYTK